MAKDYYDYYGVTCLVGAFLSDSPEHRIKFNLITLQY